MQNQILLIQDVEGLGRKGEIVTNVKPGFFRNFLLPKSMAVVADKRTIRMQDRLKKERDEQAITDRKDSEAIQSKIEGRIYETVVKVDHEGHLYGSVSSADIIELVNEQEGILLERRCIRIGQSFKKLGKHIVPIELKEGVSFEIALNIRGDRPTLEKKENEVKAESPEA
ncbi:MAG: 50S ribosomal protein L9 [Simkaniaceae bacterium]